MLSHLSKCSSGITHTSCLHTTLPNPISPTSQIRLNPHLVNHLQSQWLWTIPYCLAPCVCVCVCVCVHSVVSDSFATPWTVAHQAPLSMEFSRQEYWSGLAFPPLEYLPNLWFTLKLPPGRGCDPCTRLHPHTWHSTCHAAAPGNT